MRVLSNIKFNTDIYKLLEIDFYKKKNVDTYALSMLTTCYTSKIILPGPYRNFASENVILLQRTKDSLHVLILHASQNYASDLTSLRYSRFQGKMNIPIYQFKDFFVIYAQKNARIMLLKF